MKNDEFAFFNQQLAAMLRDGIPLEGALRRLCQEMRRGALRERRMSGKNYEGGENRKKETCESFRRKYGGHLFH